jgi:hypothetical protein
MQLSPEQQRRVEELLKTRGVQCPECGSPALASTGEAYGTANRRIAVQYFCTNNDVEHRAGGFGPYSVPLEPHEAHRIGLA